MQNLKCLYLVMTQRVESHDFEGHVHKYYSNELVLYSNTKHDYF